MQNNGQGTHSYAAAHPHAGQSPQTRIFAHQAPVPQPFNAANIPNVSLSSLHQLHQQGAPPMQQPYLSVPNFPCYPQMPFMPCYPQILPHFVFPQQMMLQSRMVPIPIPNAPTPGYFVPAVYGQPAPNDYPKLLPSHMSRPQTMGTSPILAPGAHPNVRQSATSVNITTSGVPQKIEVKSVRTLAQSFVSVDALYCIQSAPMCPRASTTHLYVRHTDK